MHELQSLLLKKLPRLGELTFGCEICKHKNTQKGTETYDLYTIVLQHHDPDGDYIEVGAVKGRLGDRHVTTTHRKIETFKIYHKDKILGHPFTHADILEALGIEYAMFPTNRKDFQIMSLYKGTWDMLDDNSEMLPRLPQNLSDLSLPEYEETRKQLISLLK